MSRSLEQMSDDERSACLLDYVHGRLDDELCAQVEDAAANDSGIAEEIEYLRGLVSAALPAEQPQDHELSWARLSRSIDEAAKEADEQPGRAANDNARGGYWRAAAIALGVLLVAETSWLLSRPSNGSGDAIYVPVSENQGADLQVIFRDSATVAEISDILSELSGNIVSGPSALGVYEVRFQSDDQRAAALDALMANDTLVESVFER